MAEKVTLREKLKNASSLTVKDYILNYSHDKMHTFAACILVLLSVFPVIYNMFFNIYDAVVYPEASVPITEVYSYNNVWMYMLYFLSVLMILVSIYQFLSLHYRTSLKEIFSIEWVKERCLPIFLLLLLVWSIISALASNNRLYGFVGDYYRKDGVITFCIFALVFLTSMLPSERQIKTICECLVATGVACGFMVALGASHASLFFFKLQNIKSAIFANSNHFGYFLSICFPLLIGLIMQDKSKSILLKLGRIAEFWLITNAMMVTTCRGSFIAIVVALVGWNIYVFCLMRSKWREMVVLDVLFLLFIFLLNTNNEIFKRFATILPSINDAIESGDDKDIAKIGSNRVLLWKMGLEDSFEKPILGYGPDNLFYMLPHECTDKPHNEFIEIAASMGYPALIFYLAGLICHAVLFLKNIKKVSLVEVMVFSAVCCYLVSSFFGNVMFYTKPYFYMMLGFSYILLRRHKDLTPLFHRSVTLQPDVGNSVDISE